MGKGGGGGGFRADFPTVYMLISNLTALVLELFIHLNANLFFSLSRSLFFCYNHFFFSFWRHLTADGKMQINVHMESLALWIQGCESVPTEYSGKIRNRCLWLCSHCRSYTTILFLEFLLLEMFLLFYFTVSAPSP